MKIGVETEYWVVDETGALRDGRELVTAHECVEPEFVAAMIEVKTPPVASEFELRHTLQSTLQTVLAAADAEGLRLVPLGTPLADGSSPIVCERGRLLERIYGDGLKPATQCAGTHVHFDAGNVARQVNLLTALDPALALVSSSPYYAGEGLAAASRPHAYRTLCGEEFVRFRDLWEYTTDVAAWDDRLAASYEAFRALALDRGVTEQEFGAHFRPEDAIMAPIRVRRDFPTVEWRAPDTTLPSQVVKLTTDVSRLVAQTAVKPVEIGDPGVGPQRIRVPAFEDLTELTTAAIEDGLDSPAVWTYLERMSIDPREYRPIAAEIERRSSITVPEARRIRLEYADRLEDDVRTLLRGTEMQRSRSASMGWSRATTDRLESW
ncbi:glutamate-cysteine ligase family protein [Halococcus sediminicola]|uniref:glutamate-cysteine ligase family protein n=1 Tax=Halococcus sediminicola TaxID=1264579 RepID=UPI000679CACA|nr:glutamate-cysteine ligase family protein [Halococcus sediminicola]